MLRFWIIIVIAGFEQTNPRSFPFRDQSSSAEVAPPDLADIAQPPSNDGRFTDSLAQTGAVPDSTSANATTPAIEFDAVSIKLNKSGDSRMSHSIPKNGDSMTFTNVPLFMVIMYAYNSDRPGKTLGLPNWTKTDRYDITAKVTGPEVAEYLKLSPMQRASMLQKVLLDRFKLQLHREKRLAPVYELVIAKSGPKMPLASSGDIPANGRTVFYTGQGQLSGKGATTEDLAFALSDSSVDRQVLDKTGLQGRYIFTLQFTMNQSADNSGPASGEAAPSIFAALQEQLGLKLVPATDPVEYLVIDHIERLSEN
jgi:uncharacterized protein (TIGR03435 family)